MADSFLPFPQTDTPEGGAYMRESQTLKNPPKPLPAREALAAVLRYEADTGRLFWVGDHHRAGREAFTARTTNGGYQGKFEGRLYAKHRIIWKLVTGEDPKAIDHINGDAGDNRWENLRNVSYRSNLTNRKIGRNNTSGQMGVYWDCVWNKWSARIHDGTRQVFLGAYLTKNEAIAARKAAEPKFGYHENHGRAA